MGHKLPLSSRMQLNNIPVLEISSHGVLQLKSKPDELLFQGLDGRLDHELSTISDLLNLIENQSINEFNGTSLYWLSYAIQWGLDNDNLTVVQTASRIILKMSKDLPSKLVKLLHTPIEIPGQKTQKLAGVFISHLHTATYGSDNSLAIICINHIFSYLLKHAENDLVHAMIAGNEPSPSAFLTLILALNQAAKQNYNQPNTKLIADLLLDFITQSPTVYGKELLQVITTGEFEGKNALYFLMSTLELLAKENFKAMDSICNYLMQLNQNLLDDSFPHALINPIRLGPYRGMNSLHILLDALTNTVYEATPNSSNPSTDKLRDLVFVIVHQHFNELAPHILNDMKMGAHAKENGLTMLIRIFCVAVERGIDTENLSTIISKILEVDSEEMLYCLTSVRDFKYNSGSALSLLMEKANDPATYSALLPIVKKLASSQFALVYITALSPKNRPALLDEYSKITCLNEEKKTELMALKQVAVTKKSATSPSKQLFFSRTKTPPPLIPRPHSFSSKSPLPSSKSPAPSEKNSIEPPIESSFVPIKGV